MKSVTTSSKQGVILYNKDLSIDTPINVANFDKHGLIEASHYLRKIINSFETTEQNRPLTFEQMTTNPLIQLLHDNESHGEDEGRHEDIQSCKSVKYSLPGRDDKLEPCHKQP